ncbi:MAG: AAA family ATPase, partial [Agathobacter rectalis]
MASTLKLPVGIENFEEIRKLGFYYIDKTRLIEQLLQGWGKVTLFTRPRRFGKTLNMSMLKSFFEIGTDKSLFDGLYISGNKVLCDKHMGKYPVIFLSFKGVEGLTYDEAFDAFVRVIGKEISRVSFLADSDKLTMLEREQYKGLTIIEDGSFVFSKDKLISSLQLLSQLLYKHYGQKVVILIDEYDVPLDKAFQNDYYKEMVSLIRGIFGQALKTNEFLQFAVLTGCLRVSKESIFTGLNNFEINSIVDIDHDEQFGFTDDE